MAKRLGMTERQGQNAAASKIVNYAEDLGRFLGSVRAKVSTYNSERQQLAKHLSTLVADAQQLLAELGHSTAVAIGRRGRPAGRATKAIAPQRGRERPEGTGRKRRKLSAAARERIRQAQLKRWAKVRAAAAK